MAEESRPRTGATRLRAEAPPGVAFAGEEGRQRIGRYEVIKTIGKGAMGVVYKARDPLLDRVVAVKTIMSPQGQGRRVRSAFLERFQREAKAAAKMQHPAIVTIFDVGLDEETGAPFMVLEYLPGESLADRLDRVRIPLHRGISLALDLASALAFAHRQRIVHRDVKPANVLHAGDNRWKLADFGIARMPDSDLTQVGIFMGTPGYSPPEAIREGRYTPQADVFAWGAVLYEVLSGRIPYEGPDTKTTNSYVVAGNAPPPTRHDPSIPELISTVIMTALQPSDKQRFKDASEAEGALRDAWEKCLTQALVHPSVLAMEEVPHDKAPARMHNGRDGRGGSARVAAQPPPIPVIEEVTNPEPLGLVIESGKKKNRFSDDDPTMLHVRSSDDAKIRPEPTSRGVGAASSGKTPKPELRSVSDVAASGASTLPDDPKTAVDGAQTKARIGANVVERNQRSSATLIVLSILFALAATFAALYYAGVIKL